MEKFDHKMMLYIRRFSCDTLRTMSFLQALMACKLFKSMAHEADQDDLEIEIPEKIRTYAM